ncbi:DUF3067 family protein [Cyanobacterium aponinum AL20118]|uniref:DUF3067 family protein n=2 Tax=Cyanobacterium aponinum TaxID=379064 RepID=A0A844GU13_9CHRO|nr:DUF3067 family protein [Cyanobacterium aponinum]MTF38288.1 DUF3067 family protein [Cyanobacterium aponinum 0216]PHV64030.1 hypothetical protein CSQ80_01920 [Cyanobacterium aponinum IPPAS B-1201]WPF87858.1 DUF3067 family protein [Cyanobacterium aponinum AL20115]WRL36920.1 DUF3067 family protein [Cyanobacterium aponinum UTEX 3221]
MTGQELQQLIIDKWGYSYDAQVVRIKDKIYFQVMWKYLEQASFHYTQAEYMANLEQIAQYLTSWGVVSQVIEGITDTKSKPRLGKAVSISLNLGERASEWILDN